MALVPCKECGYEVANSAPICPKCGVRHPGIPESYILSAKHTIDGDYACPQCDLSDYESFPDSTSIGKRCRVCGAKFMFPI
jgi:RNA polymerase subunit RPABC4/transcription elongation factor Spt4